MYHSIENEIIINKPQEKTNSFNMFSMM